MKLKRLYCVRDTRSHHCPAKKRGKEAKGTEEEVMREKEPRAIQKHVSLKKKETGNWFCFRNM